MLFMSLPRYRKSHAALLARMLAIRDAAWPDLQGVGELFCRMGDFYLLICDIQNGKEALHW